MKIGFNNKYKTGKFLDKCFLEIAIYLLIFEKTFREFGFRIFGKLKKVFK